MTTASNWKGYIISKKLVWKQKRNPNTTKSRNLPTKQSKSHESAKHIHHTRRADVFSVEDARPGYPRFSALLAAHNTLQVFRSFRALRTRLLLIKQDRLSSLESQLETIDQAERRGLNLSSIRRDNNSARKDMLTAIDSALVDYG